MAVSLNGVNVTEHGSAKQVLIWKKITGHHIVR